MTKPSTGPEYVQAVEGRLDYASDLPNGEPGRLEALVEALVSATMAHTAATLALVEAQPAMLYETDAWREVIPHPPLKECRSKDARRPECAERHTEDCNYADPVPEPPHELLPIGTRVLVSDLVYNEITRTPERTNPEPGKIVGYDIGRTKYRWHREFNWEEGRYSEHDQWAFADNRVQVHPDGPECSPDPRQPKPPTAPRVYVQRSNGRQGYVVGARTHDGRRQVKVHWLTPGGPETWSFTSSVEIISDADVERCENGADQENCVEIDLCEACEQDRDAEGDAIEQSMGLRP